MRLDDPQWARCLPVGQFLILTAVVTLVAVAFVFLAHYQGKRLGRHEFAAQAARADSGDLDRAWTAGWDAHEAAVRRLAGSCVPAGDDATSPQPRPLPARWEK